MAARTIFVLLLSLLGASALQLQPVTRAVTPLRVPAAPVCQFGGKPDTEQKGLSRDSEPEDFFKSDWGARGRRPAFSARCTSARSSPAERCRSPAPVHQTRSAHLLTPPHGSLLLVTSCHHCCQNRRLGPQPPAAAHPHATIMAPIPSLTRIDDLPIERVQRSCRTRRSSRARW